MRCLAVNTANSILSVALVEGDKLLYLYETAETRDQGNILLEHAEKALAENGMTFPDVQLLAAVTGPGSFTGIRIGLAAMRGLAMAAGLPVCGISSFDLFAESRAGHKNIVAIESWREELYFRLDGHEPVNLSSEDFIATLPEGPFVVSGDARSKVAIVGGVTNEKDASAFDVGILAIEKFKKEGATDKPVPFYLRPADITLSSKPARRTEGI